MRARADNIARGSRGRTCASSVRILRTGEKHCSPRRMGVGPRGELILTSLDLRPDGDENEKCPWQRHRTCVSGVHTCYMRKEAGMELTIMKREAGFFG